MFLLAVTLGDSFVTNTIKGIVDRSRPTIDPLAAHLGPSFPSGHSSTAAALFAALALLAGRRRSPRARAVLVGVAVGLAVAVACSRVLLDLHWVSDVVAGLTLGWAWFAVCAIAFGGWALRLGAVVEQASLPACLEVTAWTDDGEIMGVRHRTLAVEGVQFHPEAILTEHGIHSMLHSSSFESAVAVRAANGTCVLE